MSTEAQIFRWEPERTAATNVFQVVEGENRRRHDQNRIAGPQEEDGLPGAIIRKPRIKIERARAGVLVLTIDEHRVEALAFQKCPRNRPATIAFGGGKCGDGGDL